VGTSRPVSMKWKRDFQSTRLGQMAISEPPNSASVGLRPPYFDMVSAIQHHLMRAVNATGKAFWNDRATVDDSRSEANAPVVPGSCSFSDECVRRVHG
jgi:hypothetical protein